MNRLAQLATLVKAWLKSTTGCSILEAIEKAIKTLELAETNPAIKVVDEIVIAILDGLIGSPAPHEENGAKPVSEPAHAVDLAVAILAHPALAKPAPAQIDTTGANPAAAVLGDPSGL